MQPLSWYVNRLRTMSATEIAWRAQSAARDLADRYRIPAGRYPSLAAAIAPGHRADEPPAFRVSDIAVGAWADTGDPAERAWLPALTAAADAAALHRFSFFDLEDRDLGHPIVWNYETNARKPTPVSFAPSIDYRDYREVGDCKLVWEPNRHHQLVILGRAYRATGQRRYAEAIVEQVESWLTQCPFGHGMNWRSPLELGVRLINWVWAFDLIRESGLFSGPFQDRVLHAVYLHAWENVRKLSRGTSGNNHLTGELAGVYVAMTYFPQLAHRADWRRLAAARLEQQLSELAAPDGGWGEHAVGYQLFVLQFFIIVGLSARAVGEDFSPAYWGHVERMLEFVASLLEGGPLPRFGDADDGYVLNLGSASGDAPGLMSTGAVLFANPRLKAAAGEFQEMTRWLLPSGARQRFEMLAADASPIPSRPFADSGYYLLQAGARTGDDRLSVFVDCAELGFGPIAAHGHADALAFTLRAFGQDILVDPGTYDYFTYPAWRNYFRTTRAHNTVTVDGSDQSEMLGPFLWGARAHTRVLEWKADASGARLVAEHDGYTRLASPVMHRRTIELDAASRCVTVRDELSGTGTHEVEVSFHAAPAVHAGQREAHRVLLSLPEGAAVLEVDPALTVTLMNASEEPMRGWASRAYHVKEAATAVIARARIDGSASFTCRIVVGEPGRRPGQE
jgi:hypothetical protein